MRWSTNRAITWAPIWNGDRSGLEHLFENLDGSGFRAELAVDDHAIVLDCEGMFRRVT